MTDVFFVFFSPMLQDPIYRCSEHLWVEKLIFPPGYLSQGISPCQKAFAFEPCVGSDLLAMNWNRKSWNETKGRKWICKIIKCLKKKKKKDPEAACEGLRLLTPVQPAPCQRMCQVSLSWSPFSATVFGVWISFQSLPLAFSPTAQSCRSQEAGTLRRVCDSGHTWWSAPAGLCSWLCWARSCWRASDPRSGPRGSEDGYRRSERTSDPTLFLCSPTTRMWSWVRPPIVFAC